MSLFDTDDELGYFFNQELINQLQQKIIANNRMSIYKLHFPVGWNGLVNEFVDALAKYKGQIQIHSLTVRNGTLEPDVHITYRDKTKMPYELIHKYRRRSFNMCFKCGTATNKTRYIERTLIYMCSDCKEVFNESGVTGTWLDRI